MTHIGSAYDNIRLLRRKIYIAEQELEGITQGSQRDALIIRLSNLTQDLVRALHDFAELGYEEEVALNLLPSLMTHQRVQSH